MSRPRASRRRAVAAGGIVYRRGPSGVEVVLVGRSRQELWALPKGKPEPGESLEETARREVEEETGLRVEIERDVGEIRYVYTEPGGARVAKVVHHYLMTAVSGDPGDHDDEYDVVAWMPAPRALRRLTHDNERDMLGLALELVALGRDGGGSEEAAG
ncbi:MAG: NUDIX hydrolase [Chloroflexi bacterium]|nr:NUDIX hydrolase [Chloroflexota bacterium]